MLSTGDVLVIDNDPSIVAFVAELLTDEGYIVRSALNSADARAAIAERHPALILMDLHIPGEADDALIHDLKAGGISDIPIVVMTADARAVCELLMDGIVFCLTKPFELDDLLDCVAHYILREETAMN